MADYRRQLYQVLASSVDAYRRSLDTGNDEWVYNHAQQVKELVEEFLPSGSGFDSGTTLDLDRSTGEKLVFDTSFHHMNEHGFYDGWTEHTVTVTPSLVFGLNLKIGGRDRNEIKEYIHECFYEALRTSLCGYCWEPGDHHSDDCRRPKEVAA